MPSSHDSSSDSLFGMNYWLIDSRASRHMTGCRNLLVNIIFIAPIAIDLPNGSQTTATFEGSVYLSFIVVLIHVLYIPSLSINLLFVSQLLDTHHNTMYILLNSLYDTEPYYNDGDWSG